MSSNSNNHRRTVLGFQGQGTIKEGMGSEIRGLPEADEVYEEADQETETLLGKKISELISGGTIEELLEHQQLVKFVVSAASAAVLAKRAKGRPFGVTGHSLGDYAALLAAGAFTFKSGITLVHERERAMREADKEIPGGGGMVGLSGIHENGLREIAETLDVDIAAINTDTSGTLSGKKSSIDRVPDETVKRKGVRATPLDIYGAAHSRFNLKAAEMMKPVIAEIKFIKPKIPFISGEGKVITEASEIAPYLLRMFSQPVIFRDVALELARSRVQTFTEVARTRLLGSFVSRTAGKDIKLETMKDYLTDIDESNE